MAPARPPPLQAMRQAALHREALGRLRAELKAARAAAAAGQAELQALLQGATAREEQLMEVRPSGCYCHMLTLLVRCEVVARGGLGWGAARRRRWSPVSTDPPCPTPARPLQEVEGLHLAAAQELEALYERRLALEAERCRQLAAARDDAQFAGEERLRREQQQHKQVRPRLTGAGGGVGAAVGCHWLSRGIRLQQAAQIPRVRAALWRPTTDVTMCMSQPAAYPAKLAPSTPACCHCCTHAGACSAGGGLRGGRG
jgi:hypothetical protein